MSRCLFCLADLKGRGRKFCSNKCQSSYNYNRYIVRWKEGKVDGTRGVNTKALSMHLIKYIRAKYNNECALCRWCGINPITHYSPLEVDHIDGNAENNTEHNLILLCPNCHALTPTYRNLNKGFVRVWRKQKYVKIL